MSTPLEVIQEGQKTLNGEFARWQGDIVWHNANILALLQALHDELEGKKRKVWSVLEFSKLGFMEMHQASTDVSYNQAIKDQQDNLQALMDKIRVWKNLP